jgi:hypothetical protein
MGFEHFFIFDTNQVRKGPLCSPPYFFCSIWTNEGDL